MEVGISRERGGGGCDCRAIMLPPEVGEIVKSGCEVFVETLTGVGLQIPDEKYADAGAFIAVNAEQVMSRDLIVKLKAPTESEAAMMKPGAIALAMM